MRAPRRHVDRTFEALGDPARVAIVQLLAAQPLRSSEVADAITATRPATSRHLQALRRAGLIEEAEQGDDARARVYRLRREPFGELRGWLEEVEAFWGDQLASFKAHAEKPPQRARRAKQESIGQHPNGGVR